MNAPSILLLDREPMLRDATAMMLSKRGGKVTTAATLDDALELAAERVYDVAVIDVSEGSPGGRDILAAMRERGCLPRRVILCCADPQGRDGGDFTEVIQKPFPFDRLLASVFGGESKRRPTLSGVFPSLQAPAATQRRRTAGVRTPRRAAQGRRGRG